MEYLKGHYTNGFSDYMANSCVQFADDTTLFYRSKNFTDLHVNAVKGLSLVQCKSVSA